MSFWRIHPGAAVANVGANRDERRPVLIVACLSERRLDGVEVITVLDFEDLPSVRLEPRGDVLGEGEGRRAFDRDRIVVVETDELAELHRRRQRRRFAGHALHQISVRNNRPRMVVDEFIAEDGIEMRLGQRHPDPHSEPLPQRAGGAFDSRCKPALRVPRRPASPLPEILQIGHGDVKSVYVQQRIEEGRTVPRGQDEPVTIAPRRVRRVIHEKTIPQHVRHRGRAER